jgi:chorismate synthase
VSEAAGVTAGTMTHELVRRQVDAYKAMRRDFDPFYQEIYIKGRITPDLHYLEKMKIFAEIEQEIDLIRSKGPVMNIRQVKTKYGVHPVLNCPDVDAAEKMVEAINKITETGDSSGGVVEVRATGVPVGLGEPVFQKLDAELGQLLGIGAVKGVEIGAGFKVKDMTGIQTNDAMQVSNGKVVFKTNQAGGITGGLATGDPIIIRLAVKPTPTIDKKQNTIDKYSMQNKELEAITRRDPTIVARIWPVAENYTAMILLDNLIAHFGYQQMMKMVNK